MLHSMTGYGRGEASNAEVTVVVELKSVNNRFRDVQLRCPREYMALEPRIANLLKEPFHRGRIDAYVRRTASGTHARVVADEALARDYARVVQDLAGRVGGVPVKDVPFTFILAQPGVLGLTEAEVDVMGEWDVVEAAVQSAIADLLAMRRTEGGVLARDLGGMLDDLRQLVGEVENAASGIEERLKQRLETRVQRLLGERVDPWRLAQEVALLADKADISEELARLRSHCDQFEEALTADEPVGRRLDFLLQEMNREVNTVGSKAADHPVHRHVVDMKTLLERMREQSANVE